MNSRLQAKELLREVGRATDDRIDLAEAALALAALELPDRGLDTYRRHLAELAAEVADMASRAVTLEERVEALQSVLVNIYGYHGDSQNYEDMQNANLIRVIDRRKGLPVALGILFIHSARAQGWDMVGLNFPGHFLVRLQHDGERAILDPFNQGEVRSVVDLRDLIKQTAGAAAELTPEHYQPVSNRDILLRLQNNIKLRHLREERVDKAAETVEAMLLFAPEQPALWREAGLLNAHLGNIGAAIQAFETFMDQGARQGASAQLLHQTATLVQQLKNRLN
ncbi:MAG TPA: transglutaminase-like domain-containing protein [Azospirillaceae bacterium]|nr:transglutaminase-like domain-containing protein [Azospirillaceae bacterium]